MSSGGSDVPWRKMGLLLPAPVAIPWAVSHAMVPLVEQVGNVEWLYFSARDERLRGRVGRVEIDLAKGAVIGAAPAKPLLDLGRLGTFDDNGVVACCTVRSDGRVHLYYIGFNLGVTVPFYPAIGCAVSEDGGTTFERVSEAPVLGRNRADPFLTTTPWVIVDGGRWRMWYTTGTEWEQTADRPRHYYRISHAESDDGISWRPSGHACIDYESRDEYAIGRPCVIKDGTVYRMWYCTRGAAYRIGYAESADGLEWRRLDEEGLRPSASGWDSEMCEYPAISDVGKRRFMVYNGNGYGTTGIGRAVYDPI